MGIEEDRIEFNTTGVRGLLRRTMASSEEAFIKVTMSGHQGEVVGERPPAGSGPYLHYRRGEEVLEYRNSTTEDTHKERFRTEI